MSIKDIQREREREGEGEGERERERVVCMPLYIPFYIYL